jgi:ectoine hydroxylase-related dioxygenase (phytanoyl-CoA dioxygenase family)
MRAITLEDCTRFRDDGFVVFDEILSDVDVKAVLAASDRIQRGEYTNDRRPPAVRRQIDHLGRDQSIRWYLNTRIVDGELWRVTTSPVLGRAAAMLLQTPSVSLVEDQLLDKPGPGLPCNYHQDYGYWMFSESTQWISCWIALVDMTIDMGPLQLIPGSQRWGYTSNPRELIAGSDVAWLEAVERARPPGEPMAEPVTACVRAGGGVLFHGLTFQALHRV